MTDESATVYLVDDEPSVLRAMSRLLRAAGHQVSAFRSPQAFLAGHDPTVPGCVVLDLAMPGLNGLELQMALSESGCDRPIIFVTGHGDVPSSVRAMKAGAVDFLTKPVSEDELLAALDRAIERDRLSRQAHAGLQAFAERLKTLTDRRKDHQGASFPRDGKDGRPHGRRSCPHDGADCRDRIAAGSTIVNSAPTRPAIGPWSNIQGVNGRAMDGS
jgi:FixJ family two-component response regulator